MSHLTANQTIHHLTATVPLQSHCVTEDPLEPNLVPMDIQICQWTANSPMPCHLNHSCVTPTDGMPLKERVISRDPVSIVQLHLLMRLIGRFPIYREATDQPGPEMNSISNISQSSVTLPLDCHSDQVSVNGCHSDHFRSHFSQIHLRGRLIGRFPIYREATDQPGPEMNSISNISQSSVTLPLQSHCATRLKLTVKKSFKNAPLAGFQDRKGTPFEHFRRVLSTNQKPGF